MKKAGGIMTALGVLLLLGFVGTDDVETMRGMNPSLGMLIIKLLLAISLVMTGIILIRRNEDQDGSGEKF